MQVIVDKKPAALKEGASFDYVSENRLFSDSDGYTLTISFPLAGCDQNILIFGHIYRPDLDPRGLVFDCELRCNGFHKSGVIIITEVSEVEVKAQFLDGRSRANYTTTLDKVYINTIQLGDWPSFSASDVPKPMALWNPATRNYTEVALPWLHKEVMQNAYTNEDIYQNPNLQESDFYNWAVPPSDLSWQIYLLELTKRICNAIGYNADFSAWGASKERFLLLCNCVPGSWNVRSYSDLLPKWSVLEYFRQLEYLLGGEFDFDHAAKLVTFDFTKNKLSRVKAVALDNVLAAHTTQIQAGDPECEFIGAKNISYRQQDTEWWKLQACDWLLKSDLQILTYQSLVALLEENRQLRNYTSSNVQQVNSIFYAEDVDAYFIVNPGLDVDGVCRNSTLLQVNGFGAMINNSAEEAKGLELQIVPAHCEDGVLHLDPKDQDGQTQATVGKTEPLRLLNAGEPQEKKVIFDGLHVAYWDGVFTYVERWPVPHPFVHRVEIAKDWSGYKLNDSALRLNDKNNVYPKAHVKINPNKSVTFSFISKCLPDVRAVYYIGNKKYICESLTVTFSSLGMSELIKGVFWPIVD